MPRLEKVELSNPPSSSHIIHLNSISGDSPVFHASFFKSKVVKPGESTTFDVVFLARTSGAVHNTLYIHTSMGTFDYRVSTVCGNWCDETLVVVHTCVRFYMQVSVRLVSRVLFSVAR